MALESFRARWTEAVVVPQYLDIVRGAAERKHDTKVLAKLPPRRRS
jgi:hypothetical protein